MQKSTDLKKRVSNNSSSENTTQAVSIEAPAQSSKKATPNEGSRFSNFFQKLACSNIHRTDDESEVLTISRSGPK